MVHRCVRRIASKLCLRLTAIRVDKKTLRRVFRGFPAEEVKICELKDFFGGHGPFGLVPQFSILHVHDRWEAENLMERGGKCDI